MELVYSYAGKPYQRIGDDIWDELGHHVGWFYNEMVFAADGHYIGELNGTLLARYSLRTSLVAGARAPWADIAGVAVGHYAGTVLYAGWDQFEDGIGA
jgi:hypothetical protein